MKDSRSTGCYLLFTIAIEWAKEMCVGRNASKMYIAEEFVIREILKLFRGKCLFASFLSLLTVVGIVGGYIRLLFGSGGTHVHF